MIAADVSSQDDSIPKIIESLIIMAKLENNNENENKKSVAGNLGDQVQKAVENVAAVADFLLLMPALLAGVVGFANTAVRDCFHLQSRESAVLAHSRKSLSY